MIPSYEYESLLFVASPTMTMKFSLGGGGTLVAVPLEPT